MLVQVERTEAAPTITLVIMELVEVEERAEMVALGLPSRVETEALAERTCLVQHEAEEEAVTRTEMAEGPASLQVEAAAAELGQTTTLVVTHLALERLITEQAVVQTGVNVVVRMLVAQESL